METDWRRIDIDKLEPGAYITKEELIPQTPGVPTATKEDVLLIHQQIKSLLSKGEFQDALSYGLNPPNFGYTESDEEIKLIHCQTIFEVLKVIKIPQISKVLEELSIEEIDNLIKYLYKLMSVPFGQQGSGTVLAWFNKVVEINGNGPIIRYLSDRKTV